MLVATSLSLDMQMDGKLEDSLRSKLETRPNPQNDSPCPLVPVPPYCLALVLSSTQARHSGVYMQH